MPDSVELSRWSFAAATPGAPAGPLPASAPVGVRTRHAGAAPDEEHWDRLLAEVAEQLRLISGVPGKAAPGVRQTAIDGVRLLEQLRAQRRQELSFARRIEDELDDACAALVLARGRLAGMLRSERSSRHAAEHDSLTLLPNRRYFDERLNKVLAARSPPPTLSVLVVDLDDFKPVNDDHGHSIGDALLRIVAARLRSTVRADDVVCRLGGDEFGCILADPMGMEPLARLARQMLVAVSAPVCIQGLTLSVRPSIGIARFPWDGTTPDMLLQRADQAMYRAKRGRLGHAFFALGIES